MAFEGDESSKQEPQDTHDSSANSIDSVHETPRAVSSINGSTTGLHKSVSGPRQRLSRDPREGEAELELDIEKQRSNITDHDHGHNSPAATEDEDMNEDKYLVTFAEDDPELPFNWPLKKRCFHTAMYGLTTFSAQFNSSVMSPVAPHLEKVFNIGHETAILATSLYVLGIAFGPIFFAPLSEMYGRKIGVFLPFLISIIFTAGTASSDSVAAIMCTRFFAGFFAGAPVVSSGGVLADMFRPAVRGISLVFYALLVVAGTSIGVIITSLLTQGSDTAWRWGCWFIVMLEGVIFIIDALFLSESYVPVLLARRAKKLRITTRNWAYHAKLDEWELDIREFFTMHVLRPLAMFATPIVFCIAIYASFVFGVLYLVVTSIEITFQMAHGWTGTVGTLPLLALFLGMTSGTLCMLWGNFRYARIVRQNDGKPVPEERFRMMMYFGWLMPAGTFMFAWTQRASIHWIVPMIGLYLLGLGFAVIFQSCLNYLVDAFTRFAASAIAANTFTRSVFGAVFPIFGNIMFQKLGPGWGGSIIGFIALAMTPIPYIFWVYGKQLRSKNPYSRLVS